MTDSIRESDFSTGAGIADKYAERKQRFTDEIGNPVVVRVDEQGYALLDPSVEGMITALYDVIVREVTPMNARLAYLELMADWLGEDEALNG